MHRLEAQVQDVGNFLDGMSLDDESQNLAFAVVQSGGWLFGVLHERLRLAADVAAALGHRSYAVEQLLGVRAFQDIAVGTCCLGAMDNVWLGIDGEDDDAQWGVQLPERADGVDAVAVGHGHVQQEHVGMVRCYESLGLVDALGYGRDVDVLTVGNQFCNALCHQSVIVGYDDVYHASLDGLQI